MTNSMIRSSAAQFRPMQMGIDWEEILGAEGEDLCDAYDDLVPGSDWQTD